MICFIVVSFYLVIDGVWKSVMWALCVMLTASHGIRLSQDGKLLRILSLRVHCCNDKRVHGVGVLDGVEHPTQMGHLCPATLRACLACHFFCLCQQQPLFLRQHLPVSRVGARAPVRACVRGCVCVCVCVCLRLRVRVCVCFSLSLSLSLSLLSLSLSISICVYIYTCCEAKFWPKLLPF